jgi:hypothetical protein
MHGAHACQQELCVIVHACACKRGARGRACNDVESDWQRCWEAEQKTLVEGAEHVRARMAKVIRVAQNMYVSVCQPSTGVASGLGMMLAARPGTASGAVIHELIEGGPATAAAKMSVGDLILEVEGQSVVELSVGEVENLMCGPMGQPVKIRSQRSDGTTYEVILARGCGHDSSALEELSGHMQADTISTAAQLRAEVARLQDLVAKSSARHSDEMRVAHSDKLGLQAAVGEAQEARDHAEQLRRNEQAAKLELEKQLALVQSRSRESLEHLGGIVRVFVADVRGRLSGIDQHRLQVEEVRREGVAGYGDTCSGDRHSDTRGEISVPTLELEKKR